MDKLSQAKEVYSSICAMLSEDGLKFQKNDDKLEIETGGVGQDLPMNVNIAVDAERQVIRLMSLIPAKMNGEKLLDGVLAVNQANDGMVCGNFVLNMASGIIFFKLTTIYTDSLISKALLKQMFYVSLSTIDRYNDKFFMLSNGMLSVDDFIKWDSGESN